MRDIRDDLKERLAGIADERSTIQERLKALSAKEAGLRTLLEEEEVHFNMVSPSLFPDGHAPHNGTSGHTPVSRFLLKCLGEGGNWRLVEIKEAAIKAGVPFGAKKPGRVLHFALLGMAQNEIVQQVGKGVWRMRD